MTIRSTHSRPTALTALLALLPLSAGAATGPLPAGPLAPPPTTQQQKSMLLEMQDAFTKIADTVEPSVVNIKAERLRPADGGSDGEDETPSPAGSEVRAESRAEGAALTADARSPPLCRHLLEATGSGVIVRAGRLHSDQ